MAVGGPATSCAVPVFTDKDTWPTGGGLTSKEVEEAIGEYLSKKGFRASTIYFQCAHEAEDWGKTFLGASVVVEQIRTEDTDRWQGKD